jgi:DNA-binding GntR family transcriptional regulator
VETLNDMRRRHLLSPQQHAEIGAWVARGKTPEAIMAMPAHLWRALSLASVLMNLDADLTRTPPLGDDALR